MTVEGLETACRCHWLHQVVGNAGIFLSRLPHPFMQMQWHHRLMQAWSLLSNSTGQSALACHGQAVCFQSLLLLRERASSAFRGGTSLPVSLGVTLAHILNLKTCVMLHITC